jgi:squalene-hopene/tetraprenyl-beta-curcumene cyclase
MKRHLMIFWLACGCVAAATEQAYQDPAASATEPLAKQFSPLAAARALDTSVRLWQEENRCIQCHANMHYGLARPLLNSLLPQPAEYDALLRELVEQRWPEKGLRYPMEPVVVSMALVAEDRTTGSLRPVTRTALAKMLGTQRPDGGWTWNPGAPKAFIREYEGTLLAALNIISAPGDFQNTAAAQTALARVRDYVPKHPPPSAYGKAMLLWASSRIEGLAEESLRVAIINRLLSLRSPDGGWAIENLIVGTMSFEQLRADPQRPSDAYATGFIIYVLRQAGIPSSDSRLRPALDWIKANQRESGRWFVPSFTGRPNHVLSNSATAWAVLALAECGELLPLTEPKRTSP